ncbi:Enoyl-(Acyl carrier protein) reductase [Teratosphaeria destructans]|uniref:Enoyl-(Acyl carrier protein) reductase n=1 Tax=Teratosphaeria destructans TaxID=418781 RepID=A0A9W7W4U0_9PEZI|nr:Enoyl-(Acyl carrier protein) reductase [Teratosphaeria destructans]
MDPRLQDKVAIITGASSGIGRATALKFANSGARVVCADIKSAGTEAEIQEKHGESRAVFIACNVTEESQIERLVQETVQWGGRLDIMCNYAGIAAESTTIFQHRTHDLPTELLDWTWQVNVKGVWLCCKYAIKQMLAQEPRQPNARGDRTRGWIVNAASIAGVIGLKHAVAYTTSKHAVLGMTKQMALDYAQDKIHVNAVAPGFVKSPMIQHLTADAATHEALKSQHPWGELGHPDDVANAALFLVSEEAAWMTGHSMIIDGGYTAQ